MQKYPFTNQTGFQDCAAACTQMILKYYGGYSSMYKLSEMLKTTKNGTTAYDIVETLNSIGFESYGKKHKNLKDVKVPCIAHMEYKNYKHYIVIYEINFKRRYLKIADPASKIKKISFEKFLQNWSLITIEMKKVREVLKDEEIKSFKFIYKSFHKYKKNIIIIGIISIILCIFSFAYALILQKILEKDINIIKILSIIIVFKCLLEYLKNKLEIKLNKKMKKDLSEKLFQKLMKLPYLYYRNKTLGEVMSYYEDTFILEKILLNGISFLFLDIPLVITILLFILNQNISIFFIYILSGIINLILLSIYHKKNYTLIENMLNQKSLAHSYMAEAISAFESIKGLKIKDKIISNFENKNLRFLNAKEKYENQYAKEKTYQNLLNYMEIIIFLLISYKLDLNKFILYFLLFEICQEALINIYKYLLETKEAKAPIYHIKDILFAEIKEKEEKNIKGDIKFSKVSYTFDKKILKDITIEIKEKSKVMVIGPSGSGKSTLFKILAGFYDNYEGNIYINEKNIKNTSIKNIIYIGQEEKLFTDSLENNLNIKGKNNNIKTVEIENLDQKGLIQEDGFNLSGGQKQRVALARALTDFDTLIIDEGLSETDTNMERRILKNILKKYHDKTIIFISHRLDNKDLFSRLIKIENGKITLNTGK